MKMKKVFGMLLTLAMVIGLLPGMCLTAYAVDYDIWVGDRQVTSDNASDVFGDGTVEYTPASGTTPATLTLKDYNGTKYRQLTNNYYGIYSNNANNDLKIITSGTNSITAEAAGSKMYFCGIYVEGDLTIGGSGSLSVRGGADSAEDMYATYGIDCGGYLTIESSVRAEAGEASGYNGQSYGVWANDGITVNGSLTATASTAESLSMGIGTGSTGSNTTTGGIIVNNGGILNATGGTVTGRGSNSYGVYVNICSGTGITVNDGGTFNATGGTVKGNSISSYGAYVYDAKNSGIIVDGGILNATGGIATEGYNSYGAFVLNTSNWGITVKTGSKMNATGQAASSLSEGTVSDSGIAVEEGGMLMAIASTGEYAYGIQGKVTVGGTLLAAGSNFAVNGYVINSITGTGWTNTEGTEGMASIDVSPRWQTLEYKRVQFPEASAASVTTKPEARTLTYSGSAQELVTAGAASGGKMQYALGKDDKTAPTSGWSTSIPKGTDAGTYYVWYKVVGDEKHNDTTPVCIPVTIAGGKYVVALVDNGVHEIGDQKDCRITVRSEPDSSMAYDNYQNTRMDGAVMPNGSHTAEKGSLIVTLKAAYLDTLAIGKHKATINFKDGSVDVDITIKEGYVVPKTGDSANPVLWIGLILLGLLVAGGIIVYIKKGNKRK